MGAPRCIDCNKFVSLEQEENIEIENEQYEDGELLIDVRLVLNCAECSSEVREASCSYQEPVVCPKCDGKELEVSTIDGEPSDRWTGKGRYARHFWGVNMEAHLKCACGEEFVHEFRVEEMGSGFDDIN